MKPEDLSKSLDFMLDAALQWVDCLRRPATVCRNILEQSVTDRCAVKTALKLWCVAFVLAMFLQGWAYRLHGISPGDMGFQLTSAVVLLALLLSMALVLYLTFKWCKVADSFSATFVAYTVHVCAIMPVSALLASPGTATVLNALKKVKAQNPSLEASLQHVISDIAQQDQGSVWPALLIAGHLLLCVATLIQLANAFDFLSRHWAVERAKVFKAGTLGLCLGVVPSYPIGALYFVTIYAFL